LRRNFPYIVIPAIAVCLSMWFFAKQVGVVQALLPMNTTVTTTTEVSQSNQTFQIYVLFPIVVYIVCRLSEEAVRKTRSKFVGDLTFGQFKEKESAYLTINTRNQLYLDEMYLNLPDREVDVLEVVRKATGVEDARRIQITPLDRIQIECIIQESGDRRLFLHSYVGSSRGTEEMALDKRFKNAIEFMRRTKITIESSKKSYDRFLFDKARDKLARLQ